MRRYVLVPLLALVLLGAGCGSSEEEAVPTTCRMYELTLQRALVDRSQAHLADDLDPDTVSAVATWWAAYAANRDELRNRMGWTSEKASPGGYPELGSKDAELDRRMTEWGRGEMTDVLVEEAYAAGDCMR